jgi:putative ABC transport system permease protein
MWISVLNRKLLRETARLKGQIVTIAIVLASGIVCFIAMRGTFVSLLASRDDYYERQRFADVFAHAERVPETIVPRIEALRGVASLQTRISEDVALPIEGLARPAYGRMLSLPDEGAPLLDALYLKSGRFPERDDELLLLESFADAYGLLPGHRVPVIVNGKRRSFRIAGVAMSPEFVYAIRPGALVDDPKRHAVLWMRRSTLASAFDLGGAFNDVVLKLAPGASEEAVRTELDRVLAPYGGDGAVGRKDQISNRIVSQELDQLGMLSTMVPAIFIGVTAFLVNLVLGRLIRLQRPEIATLKAVGYGNGEVGRHYLGLVLVVLLPGSVLGLVGGVALGRFLIELYGTSFRFPLLIFRLTPGLVVMSVLASALAAATGAWGAVRSAVRLPPAEAMQPPAPARYRRSLVERLGVGALAGAAGMMIFREIARRPLRTLLSSLGIAGAVSLMILGHFGLDSLLSYFEGTFRREQRQDLAVVFAAPVAPAVVSELGRVPGVITAEGLRAVPIRIRHEHRARDTVMMGLPAESTLRRLVGRGGSEVVIPADGVVLTKTLGEVLGLGIGDRPYVEVREGDRRTVRPVVVGFVDESVGMTVYARAGTLSALEGDLGAVSSVLLKVDPQRADHVEAELRRSPHIIDVSDAKGDMQRLLDMNASFMNVWTAISIALSAGVVFGVVYNNARIGLAARARDLASLRVLGFTRGEISMILLGSQAVEVGLAIPLGLFLGRAWARQFMKSVDQETFRWAVTIAPTTYLMSVLVTLLAAAASALWVRRSLDTLDLVSVLKARE